MIFFQYELGWNTWFSLFIIVNCIKYNKTKKKNNEMLKERKSTAPKQN